MTNTQPRAWQRMLSGRRLNLLDPSPVDIEIIDIAQGLCRVARWNGQTLGEYGYSVAQHSLLCEHIMRNIHPNIAYKWLLACLLHDASEYVIGDMISPFKNTIGDTYKDIEKKLESAIHIRYGLPAVLPKNIKKIIKSADIHCAYLESVHLAGFSPAEGLKYIGTPPPNAEKYCVTPLPPTQVYDLYIQRFEFLLQQMDLQHYF